MGKKLVLNPFRLLREKREEKITKGDSLSLNCDWRERRKDVPPFSS